MLVHVSTPPGISCALFLWGKKKETCTTYENETEVLIGANRDADDDDDGGGGDGHQQYLDTFLGWWFTV